MTHGIPQPWHLALGWLLWWQERTIRGNNHPGPHSLCTNSLTTTIYIHNSAHVHIYNSIHFHLYLINTHLTLILHPALKTAQPFLKPVYSPGEFGESGKLATRFGHELPCLSWTHFF